jgi:hypothetical protein
MLVSVMLCVATRLRTHVCNNNVLCANMIEVRGTLGNHSYVHTVANV